MAINHNYQWKGFFKFKSFKEAPPEPFTMSLITINRLLPGVVCKHIVPAELPVYRNIRQSFNGSSVASSF
jgi:hypothetical protein